MKQKYNIQYYITNRCNFSCDYCCSYKNRDFDYEPTESNIETLLKNLEKYDIGTFIFFGGEPTISNKFSFLLERVSKVARKVRVVTNGSHIDELVKNKKDNVEVTVSLHLKYLDRVIDNVSVLKDLYNTNLILRIMPDKRYFDIFLKHKNVILNGKQKVQLAFIHNWDNIKTDYTDNLDTEYNTEYTLNLFKKISKSNIQANFSNNPYNNKLCVYNIMRIQSNGNLMSIKDEECMDYEYKNINFYTPIDYFIIPKCKICNSKYSNMQFCYMLDKGL